MFYSLNYSLVVCDKCGAKTIIMPMQKFDKLICKCEENNEVKHRPTNQTKRRSTKA